MYIHPEYQKRERPRPIVLPLFLWLAAILTLIFILAGLSGCATTKEGPRQEVCRFQLLGQTTSGLPVVATLCVTPEQFAESQK